MTSQPTDVEIEGAARWFRAGIDALGPQPWARQDLTFPRGACGHAAELLGRYLICKMRSASNATQGGRR
ncbi:MAG: hypothetical protein JWL84_5937 [Rhodospirillales bacterium]|nr:hypothetical protein [Rhodospirillales bacterium]